MLNIQKMDAPKSEIFKQLEKTPKGKRVLKKIITERKPFDFEFNGKKYSYRREKNNSKTKSGGFLSKFFNFFKTK